MSKGKALLSQNLWVGVDIGGTKTAVVLSASPPEVLGRIEFATSPEQGPEPAIQKIKAAMQEMLGAHGQTPRALRAIGISCGGPLDSAAGVIQAPPNLPTWINVRICAILSEEFRCPVRLENDANAGAIAEHRFGAGKGSQHMVFLTLGTGLGAGILIDGRLYRGANDMAGEIGHVRLTRGGPVGYNKAGSAEGWTSGAGMAQVAEQMLRRMEGRGEASVLFDEMKRGSLTARDVGLAARSGDPVAKKIVRVCGLKLGRSLAILVDILNPECIVLGGLAARLGDLLLKPARESLNREALKPALDACRIVPALLGESIGDVAALCIAIEAASATDIGAPPRSQPNG